jgi:hypothetical protein
MATRDERDNSLIAVARKVAQLELELPEDDELKGQLDTLMDQLGPITDAAQHLLGGYQVETNRMANEGELD